MKVLDYLPKVLCGSYGADGARAMRCDGCRVGRQFGGWALKTLHECMEV